MQTDNVVNTKALPPTKGSVYAKFLKAKFNRRDIWGKWGPALEGWICTVALWASIPTGGLAIAVYFAVFVIVLIADAISRCLPQNPHPKGWTLDTDTFVEASEKIAASPNELEREHIPLGVVIDSPYPVLLHAGLMGRGAHIIGPPGVGKSMMLLALMRSDILAGRTVVFIDAKGSLEDQAVIRGMAAEARIPCRTVSTVTGRNSHGYNIVAQDFGASVNERSEILLEGESATAVEKPGDEYFRSQSSRLKKRSLRRSRATSCLEHLRYLQQPGAWNRVGISMRDFEHASGVMAKLDSLARITSINAALNAESIDVSTIGTRPEVIIFDLPAMMGRQVNTEIGRIFILQLAAALRHRGGAEVPIRLYIDEAADIAENPAMSVIFRTCRDLNMGCIFAHQSMHDISKKALGIVQACTAVRLVLGARDDLTRTWLTQGVGGTEDEWSQSYSGDRVSETLKTVPRMGDEEFSLLNGDQSIVYCDAAQSGFTRYRHPFLLRLFPHFLTNEKKKEYLKKYGNYKTPYTVLNVDDPTIDMPPEPEPAAEPTPRGPKPQPAAKKLPDDVQEDLLETIRVISGKL